jgi:NADP-dependent 3-hydroxy acid dehydrogenase YdfG
MGLLDNKVVLITGASRGIGKAKLPLLIYHLKRKHAHLKLNSAPMEVLPKVLNLTPQILMKLKL